MGDMSELQEREDKLQGLGTSLLRKEDARFEAAKFVYERHAVVMNQAQCGGIVRIHQHGIARGAVEWINFSVDERVELFPAPC